MELHRLSPRSESGAIAFENDFPHQVQSDQKAHHFVEPDLVLGMLPAYLYAEADDPGDG